MDPVTTSLMSNTLDLFTVPPPASGPVLTAILNIMDSFPPMEEDPVFYLRLVESFKWSFAARSSLGDPSDGEITDFIWLV